MNRASTAWWRYAFFMLLIASLVINCSETKKLAEDRSRIISPSDITNFHTEMRVKIGWVPYENQKLILTGSNQWKIVPHEEEDKVGYIPTMIISYPESGDSIMLDMNIKNELLGKLIKHSAMTMVPIHRPFIKFFEEAKCQNCHPSDIKVDFGFLGDKSTDWNSVSEQNFSEDLID